MSASYREDPARKGLLYAGTELGMYVSFDDGASWTSLQLNLPVVPITDLTVHGSDLVASTQGRGFWILDDLTPIRQLTTDVAAAPVHLFQPRETIRMRTGGFGGGGAGPAAGQNPPAGVIVAYYLAEAPKDGIVLEILDQGGKTIRTFRSRENTAAQPEGGSRAFLGPPPSRAMDRTLRA